MLDINKPVQTTGSTEWTSVEIIRTDLEGGYPVAAIVTRKDGTQGPESFTADGKYIKGKSSFNDLINVPEKHEVYLIKRSPDNTKLGDSFYFISPTALGETKCISCIKVEVETGRFDE